MSNCKLGLGTAQFGLPYGVANREGQVSGSEIKKILKIATKSGIKTLDTAVAYGESENNLGCNDLTNFEVITKFYKTPTGTADLKNWVDSEVAQSLERLKLDVVEGILFHRAIQLLDASGEKVYEQLCDLKAKGVVKKIGISVYSPDDIACLPLDYNFDIVQAPLNVLDRRILTSARFQEMLSGGAEFHARSVFLQGLLLMSDAARPSKFTSWSALWKAWHGWLHDTGQTPLEACINSVISVPEVTKVIVGVDSAHQLQQIVASADSPPNSLPSSLQTNDLDLINPSRWGSL